MGLNYPDHLPPCKECGHRMAVLFNTPECPRCKGWLEDEWPQYRQSDESTPTLELWPDLDDVLATVEPLEIRPAGKYVGTIFGIPCYESRIYGSGWVDDEKSPTPETILREKLVFWWRR